MTTYFGCGVLTLLRGWKPIPIQAHPRVFAFTKTTWLLTAGTPSTSLPTSDIKINCLPTHPSFSKPSFINSFNSLYRATKLWEIIVWKKKLKIGFGRSNEMVIRFGQPPSNRGNWVVKKSVVTSRGIQRACQQPLYDNLRHLPLLLLRKGNPIEFWEALHVFRKVWQPKRAMSSSSNPGAISFFLRLKMTLPIRNHKVC